MNRRGFLKMLGGGGAGIALAEAVPLGRVWSFPKKIVITRTVDLQLVAGVDWSFDGDRSVIMLTSWKQTSEGLWMRRDVAHNGVSYRQIHDWRLTPHQLLPFIPADRPHDRLLSS